MPADQTLTWRANPLSAVEMFAAAGNYNKVYRTKFLRRKRPGVTQANALLMVYTPLTGPGNGVMVGKADRWYEEYQEHEVAKMSENERRLSQAGSAIGLAAAPGAIYSAYQGARHNTGGVPRSVIRGAASSLPKDSRTRAKVLRAVEALDRPASRKAKAAALATGGAMLGLQLVNTTGDAVTSRTMARKER